MSSMTANPQSSPAIAAIGDGAQASDSTAVFVEAVRNPALKPDATARAASPSPQRTVVFGAAATSAVDPGLASATFAVNDDFRKINFDEIKITSQTPIGHGVFSVVYAAEWRGAPVAAKKLLAHMTPLLMTDLKRECSLMTHCSNHPNIVRFVGACIDHDRVFILSELQRCSMYDAFVSRKREPFAARQTLRMLHQTSCGILHLHNEGVVHRDIAAHNVLIDASNNALVCDFGLSRVKEGLCRYTGGSLGPIAHMAPECIVKKRYSEASDAWSFGVLIWEVTHGREPFHGMVEFDVATGVVGGSLRLPVDPDVLSRFGSVVFELMQYCWQAEPSARPTFRMISACLATL